jgi:hypothetical protein
VRMLPLKSGPRPAVPDCRFHSDSPGAGASVAGAMLAQAMRYTGLNWRSMAGGHREHGLQCSNRALLGKHLSCPLQLCAQSPPLFGFSVVPRP